MIPVQQPKTAFVVRHPHDKPVEDCTDLVACGYQGCTNLVWTNPTIENAARETLAEISSDVTLILGCPSCAEKFYRETPGSQAFAKKV